MDLDCKQIMYPLCSNFQINAKTFLNYKTFSVLLFVDVAVVVVVVGKKFECYRTDSMDGRMDGRKERVR